MFSYFRVREALKESERDGLQLFAFKAFHAFFNTRFVACLQQLILRPFPARFADAMFYSVRPSEVVGDPNF